MCMYVYESGSGDGDGHSAADRKPRPREPGVIFFTSFLCNFFIPDNSWCETSSGSSVLKTVFKSLTRSSPCEVVKLNGRS